MKPKQANEKSRNQTKVANQTQKSVKRAHHHANYNLEIGEEDKFENKRNVIEDDSHTISKGNENQDIRFNDNKNRHEIDQSTQKNQLR